MRIALGIRTSRLDDAVHQVRRAADMGFSGASFANIFGLEAITACAVAGREVDGIRLATAVVPTFPRHPYAMAQQAMTAHLACNGRFVLGIGLSHQIVIESLLGLSFDRPVRHMREYLSVLTALLQEGTVSHDGEVYRVNAQLERPTGDGPPVLVAALGPAMLRLTGEMADGTVTWMTGRKTIESHVAPRIREAAAAAGRGEPEVVVGLPVCVTADADAARERAASEYATYGQLPSYRAMLDREGVDGPADVAIVGDEDAVAAEVRALFEAGATEVGASAFGTREERDRTREVLQALLTE